MHTMEPKVRRHVRHGRKAHRHGRIPQKQGVDQKVSLNARDAASNGSARRNTQGGPRVVDVYDWGKDYLDIERVNACGPTIQAARDFGVALAHMHDAGAEHFGSAPTGYDGTCYFGPLQDPSRWIPVPGMMWPPIWRTADCVRWYDSA